MVRSLAETLFDYYRDIIPDKDHWLDVVSQALPTCFWTNPLKTTPAKLHDMLINDGCEITPLAWHPAAFKTQQPSFGKRWEYITGLFQIQEEVSMLPIRFLDPKPGERVLDLCAAPGNKTAEMAVHMQNQGSIIANDRNYNRMRALGQISKRLGLMNISTSTYDGRNFPNLIDYFDKVLVDVPCSGEGTFRKHPKRITSPDIRNSRRLHHIQIALLKKAIQVCKPGGRIVYSTCTFSPEENEAVINAILKTQGDIVKVVPASLADFQYSPGITAWKNNTYDPAVKNTLRVWPHLNNTGGFYVAVLEKLVSDNKSDCAFATRHTSEKIIDYIDLMCQRFNIEAQVLEKYDFTDESSRGIYMVNRDNQIPVDVNMDATGLFFMKTKIRHPKLSTAAGMLLGQYVRKNKITLTQAQRTDYFQGKDVALNASQVTNCTGTGYVVLACQDVYLGLGLYFEENSERDPMLRSLFPKYLRSTACYPVLDTGSRANRKTLDTAIESRYDDNASSSRGLTTGSRKQK